MRSRSPDPAEGLPEHLEALGVAPEERLLVALSGGLDSVVLLHLLRFSPGLARAGLVAAHLDHGMRPESARDAEWVRGLTRAWEVPLVLRRAPDPPSGEEEARNLRYRFLEDARREAGARWVATAHHADDQAETVLFRVLRGTGIRGLAGIAPVRSDASVVRPLLPWWKEELEAYAERHRVPWRVDPTNREQRYARNVLRHRILPLAEERVAPGARRALVRLARLARQNEAGWESLLAEVVEDVVVSRSGDRVVVERSRFLAHHRSVRARVLRALVRRMGSVLDEAGTRAALQFTSSGTSGRRIELPGGVVLARDFDDFVLSAPESSGGERVRRGEERPAAIHIRTAGSGEGVLAAEGRAWLVRWSQTGRPSGRWVERFSPAALAFPIRLRCWRPGDRIRLSYGSKKLTKLFAGARIPAVERRTWPVLEDREGRIVWVPGVARSAAGAEPGRDGGARDLTIAITDADDD